MKKLIILSLFTLGALFTDCSVTDSENVKTSGIWANYRVELLQNGDVYAYAVLRVGGATGTIVDLSGGEHLECNNITMTEYFDPITNYHWNRAQVSASIDNLYDFNLVRTDEEVSTLVELPEQPVLESVENAEFLTPDDDITLYWDSTDPGDYVNISLQGDCIENISDVLIPDDGSYTMQDVLYLATFDTECYLTLTISRVINGDVNNAFQSGQTSGVATDATTLHIMEALL